MFFAFLVSAIAGLSTVLGGVMGMFYRKGSHKWLSMGLGFSAGVMIYISFVELFAKGNAVFIAHYGVRRGGLYAMCAFFIGILIVVLIDRALPDFHGPSVKRAAGDPPYSKKLWRTGLLTALVIGIHNLPEGMITFLQTLEDPHIGVMLATAIAIHNIPEGMAVYIPVYEATNSRSKAMWMCFLSGVTEPLGALLAYKLLAPIMTQKHHLEFINIAIAGIMVYISVDELLPTAKDYGHYHKAMLGLCLGMVVMGLSLVMMA